MGLGSAVVRTVVLAPYPLIWCHQDRPFGAVWTLVRSVRVGVVGTPSTVAVTGLARAGSSVTLRAPRTSRSTSAASVVSSTSLST